MRILILFMEKKKKKKRAWQRGDYTANLDVIVRFLLQEATSS